MTRNQDIRKEVVLQLYGARPLWRTPAGMERAAHKLGLDFTEAEIRAEAEFLVGQHLAATCVDPTSGERRYRITSAGILNYENEG
jgi:hypothetical protein